MIEYIVANLIPVLAHSHLVSILADRPDFLSVAYTDGSLQTLQREKKMVREKDVEFDGEDGSLEVTDIRVVWIKAPSKWGGVKKFGAIAGAIAGAAVAEGVGRRMGGIGGGLVRGLGRGIGYVGVGMAISSWTRDSYYNRDANGNTESLAVPMLSIAQAAQSGNELILDLKTGGNLRFKFDQKKVIPSVISNIMAAQNENKCPYCGSAARGSVRCPNCDAPLEAGADAAPSAGASGGSGFCTNCGTPYDSDDRFCGKCGQPLG